MIYSERQLSVAKAELAELQADLAAAQLKTSEPDAWLHDIEVDALRSQIADMEAEINEYELLKSGAITFAERYSLAELPKILVQARIAKGLSQTDLATRLSMKPQQIQRYEATDYMGASLARLIEISDLLDVRTSESFTTDPAGTGGVLVWTGADDVSWDRFPAKEMAKRGWLRLPKGADVAEAVKSFFLAAAGPQFATALHRKKVHSGNAPNDAALLAWQARVLQLARQAHEAKPYPPFEHSEGWLKELSQLAKHDDGPRRARDFLAEKGIPLVIEQHLPGTYLDGAAMIADFDRPLIALTLRFDRLDNFWFVLMHELGHVFLHLHDNLRFDFFDEEGAGGDDAIETEADRFALDTLIPPDIWDQCLSRFALSEEAVRIDAEALSIHPSIIAGRIRKERNDYTILSGLVGQGMVSKQLNGEVS
jgi:HTH-type transcriptional regulator/antitoxin HigA